MLTGSVAFSLALSPNTGDSTPPLGALQLTGRRTREVVASYFFRSFTRRKNFSPDHTSVTAHTFTTRSDIEKYLAYRAAELALEQQGNWFSFVEARSKDSAVPVPKRDPTGLRYSFRMEYWRPVWRYKLAGDPAWKSWSPFAGTAFFADGKDPKSITDYEVSADIMVRKGQMDDTNPLGFEAGAVSDLLINQVSPPV